MKGQKYLLIPLIVFAMGLSLGSLSLTIAGEKRHPSGYDQKGSKWGAHGIPQGLITFSINQSEQLGLSEEQVSTLKAIRNKFRKASAPLRANLEEAEEQFTDLMKANSMDIDGIQAASQKMEALEHQLRMVFAEAISDGKKTLTPKQLKKIKELRKHHRHMKES